MVVVKFKKTGRYANPKNPGETQVNCVEGETFAVSDGMAAGMIADGYAEEAKPAAEEKPEPEAKKAPKFGKSK